MSIRANFPGGSTYYGSLPCVDHRVNQEEKAG
jgi:hypothetical protein